MRTRGHGWAWLATAAAFGLALAMNGGEVLIDSCDDAAAWQPNPDGGNPPDVSVDANGPNGPCLRLTYRDREPHWGNLRCAVTLQPETIAMKLRLRVERAEPGAAMHLWLFETDGDAYLAPLRPGGKALAPSTDWVDVSVPLGAFRYQPRGNGKRQFLSVNTLLLGCNFGDLDVCVDDVRLVTGTGAAVALPKTEALAVAEGPKGRIGILAEPGFPKQPGHADAQYLERLLTAAGFGVTQLRAGDVCDPDILSPQHFDVLVIPCAPFYPAAGQETLVNYLKAGGAFVSMGGYAFDELAAPTEAGWLAVESSLRASEMDHQQQQLPGLNTRYGRPGDTMGLHPDQIGVFDPSYQLRHVARLQAAPGQHLLPAAWHVDTAAQGPAAIAMTGSNSPVFPDVYGRWLPLLEGVDRFGRPRGPVGALVHNFAGPYAKAGWAFFGVTNQDLFDGRFPALDALLVKTVGQLCNPVFLHSLSTDLACYRQGEPVRLSVSVGGRGEARGELKVRLEIDGEAVASLPVIASGQTAAAVWQPERFEKPFYHVRAELRRAGEAIDEMATGFTVWSPQVIHAGPSIDLADNYFRFRGKPTFLTGTNQTGMMWYSANEDPLVWEQDMAAMRDYGVNLLRVLHFSPFAREERVSRHPYSPLDLGSRPRRTRRQTDAMVQLAQAHNVVFFLTLHDWMPVELSDEELAAQRQWDAFWAARYRDVPGMLYDIQNEPSVGLPDRPDIRQLAREWLATRYGSFDAAQEAWRQSGSDGELDLGAKASGWADLRAYDLDRFRAVLFDRWTRENVAGVKHGDPSALVTVGHLQHLTRADKLLGARHLDFANTHFYGPISDFRRKLKLLDRRAMGKSFSLGEFGSREAHDARTHGQTGDPAARSAAYFLAVGHYALGMGASFVACWDWKDFRDCVFPWGINHADLRPKPVLEAYRNLALLTRPLQPRYRPPRVYLLVPDRNRFGARTAELHAALLRAVGALLDCRVAFGVLNEEALENVPENTAALLWPLPYCPNDATFDTVVRYVKAGGNLYVSGDFRYDSRRRPTRQDRLRTLGIDGGPAVTDPFSQANAERPRRLRWEKAGAGRVAWVPYPMELDQAAGIAALYATFLAEVGIDSLAVTPARARVHAFEIPLADGGCAVILFNYGGAKGRFTVTAPGFGKPVSMELDPGCPGLIARNAAGNVIAVGAQGRAEVDGQLLLEAVGHQAAVALDERDLRQSEAILVLPMGPGRLALTRDFPLRRGRVVTGDFAAGKWRLLAEETVRDDAGVAVDIAEDTAFDPRLVTSQDGLAAAVRAAEDALLRR